MVHLGRVVRQRVAREFVRLGRAPAVQRCEVLDDLTKELAVVRSARLREVATLLLRRRGSRAPC